LHWMSLSVFKYQIEGFRRSSPLTIFGAIPLVHRLVRFIAIGPLKTYVAGHSRERSLSRAAVSLFFSILAILSHLSNIPHLRCRAFLDRHRSGGFVASSVPRWSFCRSLLAFYSGNGKVLDDRADIWAPSHVIFSWAMSLFSFFPLATLSARTFRGGIYRFPAGFTSRGLAFSVAHALLFPPSEYIFL